MKTPTSFPLDARTHTEKAMKNERRKQRWKENSSRASNAFSFSLSLFSTVHCRGTFSSFSPKFTFFQKKGRENKQKKSLSADISIDVRVNSILSGNLWGSAEGEGYECGITCRSTMYVVLHAVLRLAQRVGYVCFRHETRLQELLHDLFGD